MKALTVRQPWAQLIALGVKTIETRSWATKYRGPLLIHAGKRMPIEDGIGRFEVIRGVAHHWLREERLEDVGEQYDRTDYHLPLGAVVASCKLVDCVPIVGGDHELPDETGSIELVGGEDLILWGTFDPDYPDRSRSLEVMSDQLPYGDFTPGRFAWLLEDIQPAEKRCPACWGDGFGMAIWPNPTGKVDGEWKRCTTCESTGEAGPIPAKGKQGIWEWAP